jgi:hypothetical protein
VPGLQVGGRRFAGPAEDSGGQSGGERQ